MEKSKTRPWSQYRYVEVSETPDANPIRARRGRKVTRLAIGLGFISLLMLSSLFILFPGHHFSSCHRLRTKFQTGFSPSKGDETPLPGRSQAEHADISSSKKVPLEAHIMSKCPDAQDCIQKLVVPAMEQISDKVDFELSFIARCAGTTI
jgi:hypothetical protein